MVALCQQSGQMGINGGRGKVQGYIFNIRTSESFAAPMCFVFLSVCEELYIFPLLASVQHAVLKCQEALTAPSDILPIIAV